METPHKARSTSAGAVTGPEAGAFGLGGVFDHLTNEHGELTRHITRILEELDPEERDNQYPALRSQLLSHERTERAVFYAALRQFPATETMAEAHDQQISELESLLQKLDTQPQGPEWLQTLILVSVLLKRHVRNEEDTVFPLARETIGDRASHDLRADYQYAKLGVVNTVEAEFRRR